MRNKRLLFNSFSMFYKWIFAVIGFCIFFPTFAFEVAVPLTVWSDRDAYGCIPSAGYSWDASQWVCARSWEEDISFLTQDEQNDYTSKIKNLTLEESTKLSEALSTYSKKIVMLYWVQQAFETNKRVEILLENRLLSERNMKRYTMYSILKIKLQIIWNNLGKRIPAA